MGRVGAQRHEDGLASIDGDARHVSCAVDALRGEHVDVAIELPVEHVVGHDMLGIGEIGAGVLGGVEGVAVRGEVVEGELERLAHVLLDTVPADDERWLAEDGRPRARSPASRVP